MTDFPLLFSTESEFQRFAALGCPMAVPWALVAPHEAQALRNHDQSLKRLAERGGLSPSEMVAVLQFRRWSAMSDEAAVKTLLGLLQQ